MVVNFKMCKISRGAYKLTRTSLIKKINFYFVFKYFNKNKLKKIKK
jgi:hypothetical protein